MHFHFLKLNEARNNKKVNRLFLAEICFIWIRLMCLIILWTRNQSLLYLSTAVKKQPKFSFFPGNRFENINSAIKFTVRTAIIHATTLIRL